MLEGTRVGVCSFWWAFCLQYVVYIPTLGNGNGFIHTPQQNTVADGGWCGAQSATGMGVFEYR